MKKTIMILVLLALVICSTIALADRTIPVEVDVTVDFKGERNFKILMPGGLERQFDWDENETHSDVTFTHILYDTLDEDKWCSDNSELDEYKEITTKLTDMLKTCQTVVTAWNKTAKFEVEADKYMSLHQVCEKDLNLERNRTEVLTTQNEECDDEKAKALASVNSLQRQTSRLDTLDSELERTLKSKNTSSIVGFGAGLAIGWFMWKRKKEGGPSEQAETGYSPDAVGTRGPYVPQSFAKEPRD